MRENFEDRDEQALLENDLINDLQQPEISAPVNANDSSVRYGVNFLINLPLYKHTGNNCLLDGNKKNAHGEVIVNRPYFPRNNLIPFKNISAAVPAEVAASIVASADYESQSRPFNANAAESQDSMIRVVNKTALQASILFMNTYGKSGGIILDALTGIEDYMHAREIFHAVLPLDDAEVFPIFTRNVLGEEFKAPFLDQILNYLQTTEPRRRIDALEADARVNERLILLYEELLTGARSANTIAKAQIADTEMQIAAQPQRKSGYDMRDMSFKNAPEPFDLICLAHRNEKPKDERALEQARRLQENGSQPLAEVANSLKNVAELLVNQQTRQNTPPAPVAVGMSADEISQLIAREVAKGIAAVKLKEPAEEGTGETTVTTVTTVTTDNPSADSTADKTAPATPAAKSTKKTS